MDFETFKSLVKEELFDYEGELTEDTDFRAAGLDSIGVLNLMACLKIDHNLTLSADTVQNSKTLVDLFKSIS